MDVRKASDSVCSVRREETGFVERHGMEQVRHLLQAAIGMTLYCQKDKQVNRMFRLVFVHNKFLFD